MNTSERVLVLVRLAPWTERGGARIRNHWMIQGLASRYRVDLVLAAEADDAPPAYHAMLESIAGFPRVTGARGWAERIADAVLTRRPLYSAGIVSGALKEHVAKMLRETPYAAIQADLNMEAAIPPMTPVPIVYNAHNCETALQRRHAAGESRLLATALRLDAGRLARLESSFIERARLITACSLDDIEDLERLAPGARRKSALIPNGVDLSRHASIAADASAEGALLITGSMDWRPNQQGLLWFLTEVLPLLRARLPHAIVRVAGRMSPVFAAKIDAYQGVTAVPNPLEMREELTRARVVLAPITASSGTRLRILEAWAAGRPVVTTTYGALGLEYTEGVELLARDEPAAFVEGIASLLESVERWSALREAALSRVQQYDWRPICERLLETYAQRLSPAS
jgi:glycosyltransferase involved in cell wall biosynthesis